MDQYILRNTYVPNVDWALAEISYRRAPKAIRSRKLGAGTTSDDLSPRFWTNIPPGLISHSTSSSLDVEDGMVLPYGSFDLLFIIFKFRPDLISRKTFSRGLQTVWRFYVSISGNYLWGRREWMRCFLPTQTGCQCGWAFILGAGVSFFVLTLKEITRTWFDQ